MYGIDLDEELAARRYGWLLDRILDLPDPYPGGRFREAMSEDEEMAEMLLEIEEQQAEGGDGDEGGKTPLRYSQVGFREALMIRLLQEVQGMRAEAPAIAGSGKSPRYPELDFKMPERAVDRLRSRRSKQEADFLASAFGVKPEDL